MPPLYDLGQKIVQFGVCFPLLITDVPHFPACKAHFWSCFGPIEKNGRLWQILRSLGKTAPFKYYSAWLVAYMKYPGYDLLDLDTP